ncbi:MAG: porphobilinogen synthase, partial [Acidimicrobiia bacterium]|nr:porphobilinogen synthase [Acidimicrobiia bacterium]
MTFPERRMRRLRRTPALRRLVAETRLSVDDLVAPLFVREDITSPAPVTSLPGVVQHTRESLRKEVRELAGLGIPAVILFGIPAHKDPEGSEAWNPDGIVQLALRDLRDEVGDSLVLMADLCLDEYTDHGHCGVLLPDGSVDNDATVELYARAALAQASAGADVVAPSGMMDGQVAAIRSALDGEGRTDVPILAYAAKYASALYGPFRDAAGSTPAFGDRRGYQMDPANGREALREALLDVEEGADMLMVKPALAYGDLIRAVKQASQLPVAAYNVSGEYAMVKAAAAAGYLDERATVLEALTCIRRAGADIVITYHAK